MASKDANAMDGASVVREYTCGHCGVVGHNRRSCPQLHGGAAGTSVASTSLSGQQAKKKAKVSPVMDGSSGVGGGAGGEKTEKKKFKAATSIARERELLRGGGGAPSSSSGSSAAAKDFVLAQVAAKRRAPSSSFASAKRRAPSSSFSREAPQPSGGVGI